MSPCLITAGNLCCISSFFRQIKPDIGYNTGFDHAPWWAVAIECSTCARGCSWMMVVLGSSLGDDIIAMLSSVMIPWRPWDTDSQHVTLKKNTNVDITAAWEGSQIHALLQNCESLHLVVEIFQSGPNWLTDWHLNMFKNVVEDQQRESTVFSIIVKLFMKTPCSFLIKAF